MAELTYADAVSELKGIIEVIENTEVNIDLLYEKVQRASFLIRFCKDKLHQTDTEIQDVLKDLEK